MTALIAAAKKEGTLNVIALPPTWANYGSIMNAFGQKYGISIHSANPADTSQDEVNAVKSGHRTVMAPDVLDLSMAVALANTSLFAPYKVSTWPDIPAAQKEPSGLWYQDYGGFMAIGYSSKFGTITSLNDLLSPKFKGAVALNGNPTSAHAALNGVMMASLAEGGSASSIANGVSFFSKRWKVFVPQNALLGGYYAQAISKNAPHPAAARLWEEFLYSQAPDGGQNLWLQGGARPVEQAAMQANGSINQAAAARLPAASGTPTFLSASQFTDAANYLAANWVKAVG